MVTEIVKHRANRGENGSLSFYRNRSGAEADLIVERSDQLIVVELKSSQTATNRLLNAPRRVGAILEQTGRRREKIVIYGGDQLQQRFGLDQPAVVAVAPPGVVLTREGRRRAQGRSIERRGAVRGQRARSHPDCLESTCGRVDSRTLP